MNLEQIQAQYEVVGIIDLDQWTDNYEKSRNWLHTQCQLLYRSAYTENQRIVFLHTRDYYVKNSESVGIVLKNIQVALNEVDISNYFALICSTNPDISQEIDYVKTQSSDTVAIKFELCPGEYRRIDIDAHPYSRREQYQYGSANPLKINLNSVSERDKFLLSESKNFCIYPWIHMHAWPSGKAYPCCHATHQPIYGNTHRQTLAEIWNEPRMRGLRQDMLNDVANETCRKCHEQENSGFFSGRQSANKHHGHHIERVHRTEPDGTFNEF
jgi:radical SAM protein with 4Fe4S-binding SPASM domain